MLRAPSASWWLSIVARTRGRQSELADLELAASRLPLAVGEQVLDQALQPQAVIPQDAGHLALLRREPADRALHEQLGALADVRERGLELVRHVPEEPVALVGDLEQPLPQPLELPSQRLQVGGPPDRDRTGELAVADAGDRGVDFAERPPDQPGEQQDQPERHRQQGTCLPVEPPPHALGLGPQLGELALRLVGGQSRQFARGPRHVRELSQCPGGDSGGGGGGRGGGGRGRVPQRADELLSPGVPGQLPEFEQGRVECVAVLLDGFQQRRAAEDLVKTRRPLHGRDLPHDGLGLARGQHPVQDQSLAGGREVAHLHRGDHAAEQQRQRHGRKREGHQARQRLRSQGGEEFGQQGRGSLGSGRWREHSRGFRWPQPGPSGFITTPLFWPNYLKRMAYQL
jgi:hypothetical protein